MTPNTLTAEELERYRAELKGNWDHDLTPPQIDALCDAARLGLSSGWQPIETAPKDGTRVLAFVPIEHHRLVIGMKQKNGIWLNEALQPMPFPPTHWQLLPEPPK